MALCLPEGWSSGFGCTESLPGRPLRARDWDLDAVHLDGETRRESLLRGGYLVGKLMTAGGLLTAQA